MLGDPSNPLFVLILHTAVNVQVSNFLPNGKECMYPEKAMARVERRVDSSCGYWWGLCAIIKAYHYSILV